MFSYVQRTLSLRTGNVSLLLLCPAQTYLGWCGRASGTCWRKVDVEASQRLQVPFWQDMQPPSWARNHVCLAYSNAIQAVVFWQGAVRDIFPSPGWDLRTAAVRDTSPSPGWDLRTAGTKVHHIVRRTDPESLIQSSAPRW
jgi:hypothetical protein